jgi:hypothetical protein
MAVPYTFANAAGFIPLSELDANFASTPDFANAAGNITVNAQPNITSVGTLTSLSVSGNITCANVSTTGFANITGNVIGGNLRTVGVVSATGNVTGNYIIGNGSQLTGIIAPYANANVAAYLPTYTGNLVSLGGNVQTTANISATGTIRGGNLISSGIVSATGAITGSTVDATTMTTATVSVTGNVIGGNVLTSGQLSTTGNVNGANVNVAGVVSVTGNVRGANFNTAGQVSAVGNITGGNATVTGTITGGNILTAGQLSAAGNVIGGTIYSDTLISAAGNVRGNNINSNGTISAIGNITGANLSVTGNITTTRILTNNYLYANGSPIPLGNVTSSSVGYTAPYANAIATTVYTKIKPRIDVVADYGADPTGVADSSTAFQNAINAAGSGSSGAGGYGGGPAVYVPPGTYKVNSQLTVGNNTTIFGDSQWNTIINTNTTGTLFYCQGRTDGTIKGLTLQQTGSKGTSRGINTGGGFFWNFEDLNVYGFYQGFFTFQSVYHMYTRCNFEQCTYGMYFDGNSGQWGADYYNNVHTFTNCRMLNNGTGVWGYLCGATFISCDVSACTTVGVSILANPSYPAYGIVFNNIYAEGITNALSFNNSRVSIAGYVFLGNGGGKIINATAGTQVQVGVDGYCYGGFGYGAYAIGGSRVILNTNIPNATTNFADGTSSIKYFAYSNTPG